MTAVSNTNSFNNSFNGKVIHEQEFTLPGYKCTFYAVVGRLTPKEIWDCRDHWHEYVETSKGIWDNMDEERREGVIMTVKSGIERLYDTVEQWLPEALEVASSQYLDIYFKILFTDVDAEVQRELQATTFRVRDAKKEALEMLEDLA